MKKGLSLQETNYTFSFAPFMLALYKDDLIRLIETTKSNFPKVTIQIGKKRLEYFINSAADVDELFKTDGGKTEEYHCLYLSLHTSVTTMMAASVIMEITPSMYSLYIEDSQNQKLKELMKTIQGIVRNRNIFRFFRNRFISIFIFLADFLLLLYVLLFREMLERTLNISMPDGLVILLALLINGIFLVPHGQNKIFLLPENEVNVVYRNRETLVISAILLAIGLTVIFIILRLLKLI